MKLWIKLKENIEKRKVERKIKERIKQTNFKIKKIETDFDIEKIKPFSSYFRLAGIGLIFPRFSNNPENKTFEEINKLENKLRKYYSDFFTDEYKYNEEKVKEILHTQRRLGLEIGRITFAIKVKRVSENVVKSYYGDWEKKYAPFCLELYTEKENILETHIDKCNDRYFKKEEFYHPLNIYLANSINEKDIKELYDLITDVINIYNRYITKQYQMHHLDEKYQHRHDFNPEDF